MGSGRFISITIHEFLNETKQTSNDEEIQLIIDIIDGLDKNDLKRSKYIKMLKNKHNYDYIEGDDYYHIENPALNDIKTLDEFKSYSNYKKYAEKLLRIRENDIDYAKFFNYSPASLTKPELLNLMEKYKITSHFTKTGVFSSPTGSKDEMAIDWAGDTFDKSHILHEIAHFFDKKIEIPITYTLTEYGLTNQSECTCDSIMLYLLNNQYYKEILPKFGEHIEKNIPKWFIDLSKELIGNK